MEAWLPIGMMASPFRDFLGLLKPPMATLPAGSSLHDSSSDFESPRASSTDSIQSLSSGSLKLTLSAGAENDLGAEITSSSSLTRREGPSVVMVAFDATVKHISLAGLVWAMEHILKRGDTLTIVSVLDSVRGPLGYRVKVGDPKCGSANYTKLMEEEIKQTKEVWRNFSGLERRCADVGVKLVVMVKVAPRSELAICQEAMKLGACHLVLDKSLKNRRREFYMQNLSCNVTRMRRHGGVDVIRPSLDMAMLMGLVPCRMKFPTSGSRNSPTSLLPPPRLSYGDQIDEFEFSLGVRKPKRLISTTPKSAQKYSSELHRLPTAHELSSSISQSTSSVASFVSATSSSNDNDMDDDLFSIFHGSTRHTAEIDTTDTMNPNSSSSGYESDDLFSIGNASKRHTLPAPAPREFHHRHHSSIPDTTQLLDSAQKASCAHQCQ